MYDVRLLLFPLKYLKQNIYNWYKYAIYYIILLKLNLKIYEFNITISKTSNLYQ